MTNANLPPARAATAWGRSIDLRPGEGRLVFLKFVVSHPSISAATPATSQAKNIVDNIGDGLGKLRDEATRRRMAAFVNALPSAG